MKTRVRWRGLRVSAAGLQLALPGKAVTLNGIADAWSTAIMVGGETLARRALALGELRRVWLVDKQGRASWVKARMGEPVPARARV